MPGIHKDFVVEQQRTVGGGVDAGDIGSVVAVFFQPIDRRIFGAEQRILRTCERPNRIAGHKGSIIADRKCSAIVDPGV